jgi:GT2 family glycosyltransferase
MELSIIIVNYQSARLLMRCLRSIELQMSSIKHEVCVVDNASSDGSVPLIQTEFPKTIVVANRRNLGFAAGVNLGLKNTTGRFVLWLNPDTEVLNPGVSELMEYMHQRPDVGIVGPQILDPDQTIQLSCRSFPSYQTALFNRYSVLTRWMPRNRYSREYLHNGRDHSNVFRVDWVSGACLLHRRTLTQHIGGVDERFFLYGEDVDFCRRAHETGWAIHYHPAMRVMHHIGGSSRKSRYRSIVERHRSMWRYYSKHFRRNPLKDAVVGAGITGRCLWTVLWDGFEKHENHGPRISAN